MINLVSLSIFLFCRSHTSDRSLVQKKEKDQHVNRLTRIKSSKVNLVEQRAANMSAVASNMSISCISANETFNFVFRNELLGQ